MTQQIRKSLSEAAASTFEDLGFLLAETDLSEEQRNAEVASAVCVDFEGPFSGSIEIRISRPVLEALAMNMLGEFDVPSEEVLRDALGEVANVVCGNALPKIGGTDAIFRLGAPKPSEICPCSSEPVGQVILGVDEGRAQISLFSDELTSAALV